MGPISSLNHQLCHNRSLRQTRYEMTSGKDSIEPFGQFSIEEKRLRAARPHADRANYAVLAVVVEIKWICGSGRRGPLE
jgi:hypothetical protein